MDEKHGRRARRDRVIHGRRHLGAAVLRACVAFAVPLVWASLPAHGARADSASRQVAELTGALIYRICQFVRWPDDAFVGPEEPFRICVFGDDPRNVSGVLAEALADKRLHEREILVSPLPDLDHAQRQLASGHSCHLLFVSRSTSSTEQTTLLALARNEKRLLLGESLDFLKGGGLLSLVLGDRSGKISIYVNAQELNKSALRFDSRFRLTLKDL